MAHQQQGRAQSSNQGVIETALGEMKLTTTIEGRQRFRV